MQPGATSRETDRDGAMGELVDDQLRILGGRPFEGARKLVLYDRLFAQWPVLSKCCPFLAKPAIQGIRWPNSKKWLWVIDPLPDDGIPGQDLDMT